MTTLDRSATLDHSATLDPRALKEAARMKCRQDEEQMLLPDWDDLDGDQQDALRGEVSDIITAYLAVTQPIVTTVDELVELPGRSAVVDADGMVAQMDAHDPHHWDGLERCWDATQITLPARVIWRPHESP